MKIKIRNNQGMTTPEFILATMMLSAFTAVFVLVSQFIASFFQPLNEEAREDYIKAEKELTDVLQDHILINKTIDNVIKLFSQPGIDRSYFLKLECTSLPKKAWEIESLDDDFPNTYELCIKPAFPESSYQKLQKLDSNSGIRPGIYILYAKPLSGITFNSLPVRRIFCRPKPFCSL